MFMLIVFIIYLFIHFSVYYLPGFFFFLTIIFTRVLYSNNLMFIDRSVSKHISCEKYSIRSSVRAPLTSTIKHVRGKTPSESNPNTRLSKAYLPIFTN